VESNRFLQTEASVSATFANERICDIIIRSSWWFLDQALEVLVGDSTTSGVPVVVAMNGRR
jgi:hypothetical protein